MIHDFAEHHRPHFWPGISEAKRDGALRDEMLGAHTGDIATEGNASLRGAKREAMKIAGEVRVYIAGEQIDLIALAAEGEAGENPGSRVKLGFVKHGVATGRNHRAIRDAVLFRD